MATLTDNTNPSATSEIVSLNITYSWGSSPASGTVQLPGLVVAFACGDEVVINLDALTFHGVVTADPTRENNGKFTEIQIADNRIHLQWDVVFGVWNMQEIKEDDPATPGIDRMRRFWHILPEDWQKQKKTYTSEPMSAFDIIDSACGADTVDFDWTLSGHADMADTPAYNIDANNGKKLGNILQEVSDQCGMLFTLVSYDELLWARKGEGVEPEPPPGAEALSSYGNALSHNDTQVTLVGPRNIEQVVELDLEPGWNVHYNDYLIEAAWVKRVRDNFNNPATAAPYAATEEGQALLVARARSITLREYVARMAVVDTITLADAEIIYGDPQKWGDVSRMEMPVWIYLREVVLKAYRIPPDFTLNGIPLHSLEIEDGLLARVDYSSSTGALTYKNPREFYPQDGLFVVVKGQQLDWIDPRNEKIITEKIMDDGRNLWAPNTSFSVDKENKTLLFSQHQFLAGTGSEALFLFPNQAVPGLAAGHPLWNVCVPNAAATFAAAEVKASIAFQTGKYHSTHGTGVRKGTVSVSALNWHRLLDSSGTLVETVKYSDDRDTDELAEEFATSMTLQQESYRVGGYTRVGGCGTALNGSVDRVTARMNFGEGIAEEIEFTKERNSATFLSERLLDRMARVRDLFPGERQNKEAIWALKNIAALLAKQREREDADFIGPRNIQDVMQRPIGNKDAAVRIMQAGELEYYAGSDQLPSPDGDAGTPVFKNNSDPLLLNNGERFEGVIVASGNGQKPDAIAVATAGMAPVKVRGPFKAGDSVGVNRVVGGSRTHESACTVGGERNVGIVQCSYTGEHTVLAPVRIGAGAKAAESLPVVRRQPFEPYPASRHQASGSTPGGPNHFFDAGYPKIFLARGTVCEGDENNTAVSIPTGAGATGGLDDMFVLTASAPLCWLKCVFEADGTISYLERQNGASWPGFPKSFATGGGGAGSNTWYHPLTKLRAPKTGKSGSPNYLAGYPFPESGEEYYTGDGTAEPAHTIVQLTNTHLVGQQQCMATDIYGGTVMGWKLVPGPGAVTGDAS